MSTHTHTHKHARTHARTHTWTYAPSGQTPSVVLRQRTLTEASAECSTSSLGLLWNTRTSRYAMDMTCSIMSRAYHYTVNCTCLSITWTDLHYTISCTYCAMLCFKEPHITCCVALWQGFHQRRQQDVDSYLPLWNVCVIVDVQVANTSPS